MNSGDAATAENLEQSINGASEEEPEKCPEVDFQSEYGSREYGGTI